MQLRQKHPQQQQPKSIQRLKKKLLNFFKRIFYAWVVPIVTKSTNLNRATSYILFTEREKIIKVRTFRRKLSIKLPFWTRAVQSWQHLTNIFNLRCHKIFLSFFCQNVLSQSAPLENHNAGTTETCKKNSLELNSFGDKNRHFLVKIFVATRRMQLQQQRIKQFCSTNERKPLF